MWDPRNYVDSDFGLGEDERFEPDELSDSQLNLTNYPHIMTVLGPISPEELGICQPREHVLIDPPDAPADRRLNEPFRAIEELTNFVTAGGKSIVDATTPGDGRDIVGLYDVARRVPVHIICSTGSGLNHDEMLREIEEGIGPRHVRPGVIQVNQEVDDLPTSLSVAKATGLPIFVSGRISGDVIELRDSPAMQLTIVFEKQVPARDEMERILEAGARIIFTGIGSPIIGYDAEVARELVELATLGFGEQLLISQQLNRRSLSQSWGGRPGLVYLLERFTLELMDAAATAEFVRFLLVDNPMRALTIHPHEET